MNLMLLFRIPDKEVASRTSFSLFTKYWEEEITTKNLLQLRKMETRKLMLK